MARYSYGDAAPLTDGERVLMRLQELRIAWVLGEWTCHPHDISVELVCHELDVPMELVVDDQWGWTLHLPGEVLRMDRGWGDIPWRLMTLDDWAFYLDCRGLQLDVPLSDPPDFDGCE